MSIFVSSGSVLGSLYQNQTGEKAYYTGKYRKQAVIENTKVTKALSNDGDLKKTLRKLKNSDYQTGLRSDIRKATKALIKGYNEFAGSTGDGSKKYANYKKELKQLFQKHEGELGKAGISFDAEELKLDEEKFAVATNETLEKLFGAESTLISETEKIIKKTDRILGASQFTKENEEVYISNTIHRNQVAYAARTNSLAILTDRLNATSLTDSNEAAVAEMLNEYTNHIVEFYQELSDSGQWQEVEISEAAYGKIQELLELNEDYINAIDQSSKGTPFEYEQWFSKEKTSYGQRTNTLYKDLFAAFVNAEKKGFEIHSFVDYSV